MKTILIVEDLDLNIDLLTQLLEEEYNLVVAKDGAQGVAMAGLHRPDLVLMDISLPVLDGCEAARRIHAAQPALPVIGLSANALPVDIEKARAAGCCGYLTKPVDEDLLLKLIRECIG